MKNHQEYIKKSYKIAQSAQAHGNHPFGALLVLDDKIILSSENTVITDKDITRHAEMNLISLAVKTLDSTTLSSTSLYTSTEPCAMCAGALFWSGISHLIYGCSAKKLGEIAGGSFVVPCTEIFTYGNRKINVSGPILEQEGAEIHRGFW